MNTLSLRTVMALSLAIGLLGAGPEGQTKVKPGENRSAPPPKTPSGAPGSIAKMPTPAAEAPAATPAVEKAEGGQISKEYLSSVFSSAAQFGKFMQTGEEFKMYPPVEIKELGGARTTVDFQVGTIKGMPAYVTVNVPNSAVDSSEGAIWASLLNTRFADQTVQECAPDTKLVCVETRDGKCVKHDCVKQ